MSDWRETMQKAIDKLRTVPRTLALFPETRRWLEERGVPDELVELMRAYPFSPHAQFRKVSFTDVNRIPEFNDRLESSALRKNGLLEIGDGVNGDPIVVNLETGTVGFVSHDDLWEGTALDIHEIYCDLGLTVAEFYLAAVTKRRFPVDYYQARDFAKRAG